MDRETKIEKVRRLLNLAHGAGTTEAEATAALVAAQRIMLEHDIEEAEIEARDAADRVAPPAPVIGVDVLWSGNGQVLEAEWTLTNAVCSDTGRLRQFRDTVRDLTGKKRFVMRAYGPLDEIEAARLMYAYIWAQVRRLTQEEYDARGKPGLQWKYSFELGCARRVRSRLQAARAADVVAVRKLASPGALAIVDDRAKALTVALDVKRKALNLSSAGGTGRAGGDADGYAAGHRAGARVDLTAPRPSKKLGASS
jgi:hypothetical protein